MTDITHLREAKFWIMQEFKPTDAYTNEEREQQKRDAAQQAQTHAAIAIAESLEKLTDALQQINRRMP